MAFLYCFPRLKIHVEELNLELPWICRYDLGFPPCDSTFEKAMLTSVADFGRQFGIKPQGTCSGTDNPNSGSKSGAMVVQTCFALLATLALVF